VNTNLTLAPGLTEEIIRHARTGLPHEACALLAGHGNLAERFIPMVNTLASETEYEMDPAQLAATFRELRVSGEDLVAIVHSHPRGLAQPSPRDLERAWYPEAVYIIVSLADREHPEVQGFRIAGTPAQAIEIELHAIV